MLIQDQLYHRTQSAVCLFIYVGFYVAFNTVQVISRWVVGRAEETSTYSSLGFCTVNCQPTTSNYQLHHLRPCRELNPGLRGGRRECYHSAAVAPSKCCLSYANCTTTVQTILTNIPLTERQSLQDDHLSMSLRFFSLSLGIGSNNRGTPLKVLM